MLRVKICGITRPEDARLAAELGADAIGMVFYEKSPRFVTVEQARAIVKDLPPWLARVGVFVDAAPEQVAAVAERTGLTAIQLHGEETPEYISRLRVAIPVIKAIRVENGRAARAAEFGHTPILLDTMAEAPGGTGCAWTWERFDHGKRPHYFILAGGLTPDNVRNAVLKLKPDAVDVSTGVERAPGIKDGGKMKAFFDAIREFRVGGSESS